MDFRLAPVSSISTLCVNVRIWIRPFVEIQRHSMQLMWYTVPMCGSFVRIRYYSCWPKIMFCFRASHSLLLRTHTINVCCLRPCIRHGIRATTLDCCSSSIHSWFFCPSHIHTRALWAITMLFSANPQFTRIATFVCFRFQWWCWLVCCT